MTKKRIFINMHYMEIGGAERALLGLLNAIDTEKYDVDLFLNQHTGAFLGMIPDKINLLPEIPAYSAIERPIKDIVKEGHLVIAGARMWAKYKYHKYLKALDKDKLELEGTATHFVFDSVIKHLPSLYKYGKYDLAISFLDPPHIVQSKVNASKKIEWIHTDFSTINISYDIEYKHWASNDYIASISADCTRSFLVKFPTLKDKIIEIENILSPEFVKQQSMLTKTPEYYNDGIKLCSVGRICHQKNYDNIPYIASALKELGLKFKWYIIGPGDASSIMQTAKELGTEQNIEFLGLRVNPYPYIKNCDIYMQPSRYEGKSVTVREAQMLCKPIIITNYPTSGSQIKHEIDGLIVNLDNKSIANGIKRLVTDNNLRSSITKYLESHNYGNESEINKIYQLIES